VSGLPHNNYMSDNIPSSVCAVWESSSRDKNRKACTVTYTYRVNVLVCDHRTILCATCMPELILE